MTAETIWWLVASIAPGPIWWLWRWFTLRQRARREARLLAELERRRQFLGVVRFPGDKEARLITEDEG